MRRIVNGLAFLALVAACGGARAGEPTPEQRKALKANGIVLRAAKICDGFTPRLPIRAYEDNAEAIFSGLSEQEAAAWTAAVAFDVDESLHSLGKDKFCTLAEIADEKLAKEK